MPVALLVALVGINMLTRSARERPPTNAPLPSASAWLSTPYALEHFSVNDLDGRPVQSESWRGRVAVVNFWATWCLPCRREIPALIDLQRRYQNRVVVVGVCMPPDRVLPVKAITKELEVRYVFGYGRRDFALTIDMLARGRLDVSPMLSDTVGWDEFPAAFEALRRDKRRVKVLLEPR